MAEGAVSRTIELSSLPSSLPPLSRFRGTSIPKKLRKRPEKKKRREETERNGERERKKRGEKKKRNEEREVGVIRARAFLFF